MKDLKLDYVAFWLAIALIAFAVADCGKHAHDNNTKIKLEEMK